MPPEEAWIATFRETLPELYAFVARRVGGERTLAEDVTQETWLRAVRSWRRDGPPREALAWLKTTARNLVLNHFRDAQRRPAERVDPALLDLDAGRPLPGGNGVAAAQAAASLQHGLSRLGERDARLVEAFHLDGRSTRELADEQQTTERAIEGRLRRARNKLKTILEEPRT